MFEILRTFTPLVEPISLDEAFLDVTRVGSPVRRTASDDRRGGSARAVADELGLTCSVGVAAEQVPRQDGIGRGQAAGRPRRRAMPGPGVFEVPPGRGDRLPPPAAGRRLWGVGPATHERLGRLGVDTIGDLAAVPTVALRGVVGPATATRLRRARRRRSTTGPSSSERPVKSVSHEETFASDLHDRDDMRTELARLADGVAVAAAGRAASPPAPITLKVRDAAFRTVTRSRDVAAGRSTPRPASRAVATPLLDTVPPSGGVRLLGVAASKFAEPAEQLQLNGLGAERGEPPWSDAEHGRSTGCVAVSAPMRSDRRAHCRRPGCGSCAAAQQQWGTDAPGEGHNGHPPH